MSATESPSGSTAGARTAGAPPTGSRSRMPSCGRRCSTPPSRTGSNGIGSRRITATPRTSAPTHSPAPRPKRGARPGYARGAKSAGSMPASSARQRRFAARSASRIARTRPARSGCPCRPAPRTRKSRGSRGSKPNCIAPVGREASQSRPFALDRLDRPVDRALESVDRHRHVDFLGRGVARIDQGLVERADPHAIVALALEIETGVEVGHQRQVAQARRARRAAGPRCGAAARSRSAARRSARATSSAQAPAALTSMPASIVPARSRRSIHRRRVAPNAAPKSVRTSPPPRRIAARQAAWNAATSMSAQLGSNQAPVHCSRSPGTMRSSASRSRCTQRMLASQLVGPLDRSPPALVR